MRILRFRGLLCLLGAALFITGAGSADAQEGVTKHHPVRTLTNIKPVSESSYRWFPQIQPSFAMGKLSPPNPGRPVPPLQSENSLSVGGTLQTPRASSSVLFPGIDTTSLTPPDPNLAVGPNHIVEVVNSDIAWFDKGGNKQFQVYMGTIPGAQEGFFESVGTTNFVFDPKCFFDPVSQRFFVVCLDADFGTISKCLVAVSDDADPNGLWHKYRFEAVLNVGGENTWLDYPGFGCNKDALIMTGNMFTFSSFAFKAVQAIVVPKAPLLTGGAATQTQIAMPNAFTVQVARTDDPNLDVAYMVSEGASTTTLQVHAVTGLPNSPVVNSINVTVPQWLPPTVNAQSTNGQVLDSLDGRVLDANWRANRLVACHTVRVSSNDNRNMVRWYEINTNGWPGSGNNPAISQSGNVVGGAGQHFNMPGIGVNSVGDIAIVFTRSSQTIVADLMVTGRIAADPPGVMGAPVLVAPSQGTMYGGGGFNRWGDYFSVEVDPADNLSFWSVGMIGKANFNWTTVINKHTISDINPGTSLNLPPNTVAIYNDPLSNPNQQGTNLQGGPANAGASDDLFVTIDSVLAPRLGQIAAGEFTYEVAGNPNKVNTFTMRVEANAPTNATGMLWLFDYTKNKYVQLRAFKLSPTGNAFVDVTPLKPYTRWIGPGGAVRAVVRGLIPVGKSGIAPVPFTLKMDVVRLSVRLSP